VPDSLDEAKAAWNEPAPVGLPHLVPNGASGDVTTLMSLKLLVSA
jgi:hypothetical protein